MIAPNHQACAAGAWAVLAPLAAGALGVPLDLSAYLWLLPVTAGAGVCPDLDKPRETKNGKVHPGACAAEAHHFVSRAVSEVVSRVCGGHRSCRHWWSTHRLTCGLAVGAAVTGAAYVAPRATFAVAVAICGAWVGYLVLPWRGDHRPRRPWFGSRDSAWALALVAGVAAYRVGPVTWWTGVAVGLGWCMHILCDRAQSACFKLGGPVERVIAAGSLALTGWMVWTQVR